MKKSILLSLYLVSLISLNAYADSAFECTDGKVITGVNNKKYCESTISLRNWYAGLAWCDAHHMQAATMHELCDVDSTHQWDGNTGNGKCLNFIGVNGSSDGWSSTLAGDGKPIVVQGGNGGNVYTDYNGRGQGRNVFCKMF